MVEIPDHRSTERHGGEPSAYANCPSPRSPHAPGDASLDELRCECRRLYRSEPPRISRDLLIRGVGSGSRKSNMAGSANLRGAS